MKQKKIFWTSLFTPKSCGCYCGTQIEEVKEEQTSPVELEEVKKEKSTSCNHKGYQSDSF